MQNKTELTLLGIWNILPVEYWTWFAEIGVDQLERLTGLRLGTFCYIKNDLNYECFLKKDTDALRQKLDDLPVDEQIKYVQRITDDYYDKASNLEKQIKTVENLNIEELTNEELGDNIMALGEAWLKVVFQIWYAVLLDIWYPGSDEKLELKGAIAKARDHCGHLHKQSRDGVEKIMYSEAAKRLGLSEREVYFMIQPEIAEALRGNLILKEELKARMELWVGSNYEGRLKIYSGNVAEKFMENFSVPEVSKKVEDNLKGSPACMGETEGIAHVILLDNEFDSFKEDEILVSLQTMVHYVPIMKKAKAILTEFGGLTSHAAIVSRELNKPCIVGIKGLIASVKTGDTISIDANKGIVKILKRA